MANFSVKGQTVNVSGFVHHTQSLSYILCFSVICFLLFLKTLKNVKHILRSRVRQKQATGQICPTD